MKGSRPANPRYDCNHEYEGCRRRVIAAPVDQYVIREVSALVVLLASVNGALRRALIRAWERRATPAELPNAKQRQRDLEQALVKARQRVQSANDKYVDDLITKEVYDDVIQRVQVEIDAAEAELRRLTVVKPLPTLPPLERVLDDVGGWEAALTGADYLTLRRVLPVLIKRVTAPRSGRGTYNAAIEWTPLGEALRSALGLEESGTELRRAVGYP